MAVTITNTDDIRQLGTIMSVWAHPDDESFTCAGIMAAAVRNGQQVVCITATRGELGVQDESRWPARRLGEIRAAELQEALNLLGVTEHHWLDYTDGSCAKVANEEAVERIAEYLEVYKPDTILTFGPDGITGHDDHKAVSRWACQAAAQASKPVAVYCAVERQDAYDKYLKEADKLFNIYFNIEKPLLKTRNECDIYFELTPELCKLKHKALRAMPSQTEGLMRQFTPKKFEDIFGAEAFVKA